MEGYTTFEFIAVWCVLGTAILGLLYAFYLSRQILSKDEGTEKMQEVAGAIREGANTYLKRQFKTIVYIIGILAIGLYLSAALAGQAFPISIGRAAAFLMGALFSASVGYIGMNMAVRGNVRVASAARRSFAEALKIAYRTGTITGMLTDGLGLLGGTIIFIIFFKEAPEVLLGFGFGGTLLALFMRVGGGIYTKAADVGADLVGKVEAGIPEDDPRNAAVIADLVGDNVGDCAGMAADIFESYEVTIVSAMILGLAIQPFELKWILFPLMVRAIGVFASILGTYSVRTIGKSQDAMAAIKLGFNTSAAISVVGFGLLSFLYVQDWRVFVATLSGILLAVAINYITDFATGTKHGAVQEIAESTRTGSATVILSGLASGMESSVWALFSIVAAIGVSVLVYWGQPYTLVLYGVALAGIGMLTLTGNNVAMDAFGPISDNANGIGEMAGLDEKARQIMADLDAVGNTTKAITKGIAIGSAVIAAVSLFGAFGDTVLLQLQAMGEKVSLEAGFAVNVADPMVFIGLLIGGAIPFLFSSMAIRAVSRAASLIVNEVRRQFRIPGLMEGKVKPDYTKAVNICTSAAQKELIGPALLAVLAPLVVGLLLKEAALGGFLAGIIVSGQLLAVFMSNTGGAWDNAKKYVEDGHYGGKGSDAHKASVVGDTVGDPLKDTAGPALNPLIKVMNLVGLLIAPIVVAMRGYSWGIVLVAIICLGVIAWAVWNSKRKASWEVGHEEMQATIEAGGSE